MALLAVHLNKVGLWVVMNGGKHAVPINGLLNKWVTGGFTTDRMITPLMEVLGFSTPFTTSRVPPILKDCGLSAMRTSRQTKRLGLQRFHHRLQRREIQGFFRRIFGSWNFRSLFCGFKRWKRSDWLVLFPELFRKISFLFGIFHLYIK